MKSKLIQLAIALKGVKPFILVLVLGGLLISCSNSSKNKFPKEIYVSINGDDSGDGSISKPYATILGALEASRNLRESGFSSPIVIYLREGRHQLNQTLVLDIEDGRPTNSDSIEYDEYGAGVKNLPAYLTFSAYQDEQAVVSGGVPITDWRRVEQAPSGLPLKALGNVWVADIPEGLEKFHTLYDNRRAFKSSKKRRICTYSKRR